VKRERKTWPVGYTPPNNGRVPSSSTPDVDPTELTFKELRFVQEYLIDGHGTNAAIKAGYKPQSAHVMASELLRKPKIHAAIARVKHESLNRAQATQDGIVQELVRMAYSDPRRVVDPETGSSKPLSEIDEDTARAISAVEFIENTFYLQDGTERREVKTKYRFWPKEKALEMLGKMIGTLVERGIITLEGKVEHSHSVTLRDRLAQLTSEQLGGLLGVIDAADSPKSANGSSKPAC